MIVKGQDPGSFTSYDNLFRNARDIKDVCYTAASGEALIGSL